MGKKRTPEILGPPAEQLGAFILADVLDKQSNGRTMTIGKAYRRRPMIETLLAQGIVNAEQYRALNHYRHHAAVADRSPLRDSLMNLLRVSGTGLPPGVTILNAQRVRDDCERAAGSLVDIMRAVAVDDVSPQQWAMSKGGSVERCYDKRKSCGKVQRVCQIKPSPEALRRAHLEIAIAGNRIQAELDAGKLDR